MKNIKYFFKQKANKFLLVSLLISFLCPVLIYSYSNFIVTTDDYKSNEMFIGKLVYSMRIDGVSTNSVTIPANSELEVIVQVTSLNEVSSNYKIVYNSTEGVTVVYASDDNEPAYGLITTSRMSTVLLTNSTNESKTITFEVVGGYKNNDVAEIIAPTGYSLVMDTYMKYDYETVAIFVDGERVAALNTTKKYRLLSSTCTNGETVIYDDNTSTISVTPAREQTKCELYFREVFSLIEKMNLASAQSDEFIDFSKTNDGLGRDGITTFGTEIANSNGQGLYYTSDLTKTEGGEIVYYYRGMVENNYVVFAGFCWRIVRTNEDGSIKLRYGGVPTGTSGNYTCPQTGTDVGINDQEETRFNLTSDDNTYVGYMMGLNGSGTSTVLNAQANIYDSNIKSVIDEWYENNIANQGNEITSKIANTIYCNDRSVGNPGNIGSRTYVDNAFGNNLILYGATRRLATGGPNGSTWSTVNAAPQYKCPNVARDGFTLSYENGGISGYGNNKLTFPVGLLTPDEVAFAGGAYDTKNSTYYLKVVNYYFTMGPFYWVDGYACMFRISISSNLGASPVNGAYRTIPVISIISDAIVLMGTGAYNSPYEIE